MFFNGGDAHVDAANIAETGTAQPALQCRDRGQEPHVAHLRVAVFRHQHLVHVTFDHQGFQHQFAAFDQAVFQCQQMLDGRTAVVEHTHGKYSVETFQVRRQVFERKRQVPRRFLLQKALHGLELAEEQPVGVDADYAVGACAEHAPHVVAVAAAHIEDALALEVDMRRDPRPFPVRVPLGIDVNAKQVERAFAPR